MLDYIIVGLGLAGISFCEQLMHDNKSFVVYEDNSQRSSVVAGGLYNPVILKRFTPVWNANSQLKEVDTFYSKIEKRLLINIDEKIDVYRKFASIEEQNLWFEASDKPKLSTYLATDIIPNTDEVIQADCGFGKVNHTGRVHTNQLLNAYRKDLQESDLLIQEKFLHEDLEITQNYVQYKDIKAKYILFCEGYGLKQNLFFKYLPLNGTKGELLTIKAPDLDINFVLKSSVFIIPIGSHLYKIGATYNWTDKTNIPTEEAKQELLQKLDTLLSCDYEVVEQIAGIRPTVIDRRPLVGRHPKHKNVLVLNGLGTRGVMIAPTIAKQLYQAIENNRELPEEINITRFLKLYEGKKLN